VPEDIALFIDFENIRYSMLNIQRREPDPQELIAVARRYGTVMVARAYADWSRQPEPFKGSLTAAMIDRVDCPAKQRDRIRMGTIHYNAFPPGYVPEQGIAGLSSTPSPRQWPSGVTGQSGPLPAINPHANNNGWYSEQEHSSVHNELDENVDTPDDTTPDETYGGTDYAQRDAYRQSIPYQSMYGQHTPSGPLGQGNTGPLGSPYQHTGNTGHMPAVNASGSSTVVQSTVIQSTVDLNMLMDIIETVFDRPTISTFVLMTGDKDFTRISARLKLRLNKTVIIVGIPGTVSRDLISSANQFVPLVPSGMSGSTGNTGALPAINPNSSYSSSLSSGTTGTLPSLGNTNAMHSLNPTGNTGALPAVSYQGGQSGQQFQSSYGVSVPTSPPMDVLDPQFLQFLDYIDRNWSWRTIIGVSNFIGDPVNPKNRFRGRLTRESARELLNACIQQGILLLQTDPTGAEDLRLNRMHPGVDEVLKQFVR
jgi:uncharacterized LabA/DUF88 family protein